ncbi:MAG: diguanylate cyclase [Ramlibacter sp.]|nr:diguanylate cyclase [Ramlibacter sp.]
MALLFALAVACMAPARAAAPVQQVPVVMLDAAGAASIDAETRGLFWLDSQGSATIDQVALTAPARFQPMRADVIYTPGETGALWLYYRLERERTQRQNWLIEFPIPVLDLATVYQKDARGQWQSQTAGDTLAVDAWPEPGRYPFFRLDLPPGQPRDVFVRIRHTTPISLPVVLSAQSAHDQRIQIEYMGLGMAFGALTLLIAACIAQARVYRDRVYAWYSAYAAIMTLAVAAYTGVGGHLLWSGYGYWTDASQGFLALLAGGAALLFVRHLTGISARFRWLDRAVRWAGWAGLVLAALFLVVSKPVGLMMVGGYVALAAITNTWIAWLAWRRGDVVGLWVLAAYVPLTLSVLLAVLRLFGLLPISFGTQYAVVLGSALEVPLLLVALSIRSRERHGAHIRELALSSQDALTGLLAAHLFHDRLRQVVARYRRDQQNAAVIFIDLVNYQRIKSFHGSAVAEQSLLRSVIKLRRLLRDVDTVSRVGEARFGLILEGVNSRAAVTDRAARLIAAGLMPLKGLKPEVTLQFHIGSALLSERLMDAPALASALSDLLGSMSSRTRRPIRFLEPEATQRMPLAMSSLYDGEGDDDSQLPRPGTDPHPAQSNA